MAIRFPVPRTSRHAGRAIAFWFIAWCLASLPAIAVPQRIFIEEYQVKGVQRLTQMEIEEAVYPYLGPGRSQQDVEHARAALEKKYQDKGFQTVVVQIPSQPWQDGSLVLEVTEMPVGRLRVRGARYFEPNRIRAMAPSLAEGEVINFTDVNRDLLALNQQADRRVTPSLNAGRTPGTVDIELEVKDSLPLHGSLELNNRCSADTTPLRFSGAMNYDNLWQRGHSIGGSFQVSPQNLDEVKVFSGHYVAPVSGVHWLSLMLQGMKQDSSVSTLGDLAVAGRGETIGARAMIMLPGGKGFSNLLTLGLDYKCKEEDVTLGNGTNVSQVSYTYFPFHANYSATWIATNSQTELSIGPAFGFRGLSSAPSAFEATRYRADSNFVYLRSDLAHTRSLPHHLQAHLKLQGQVSSRPLVSAEQFGGGGLGTARGYLEGEVFGDNAIFGGLELRSPSLCGLWGDTTSEWRVYLFAEGGRLTILEALPQQQSAFDLASFGIGSRFRVFNYFHGSLDLGVPVISQSPTSAWDMLLTFRLWAAL